MPGTREFIIKLLADQERGVQVAFHELANRAESDNSMQDAAIIGLSEWRGLENDVMSGMLTQEEARVQQARLKKRILMIADRLDRSNPIDGEVDRILAAHQRAAAEVKADRSDAESILETARSSASPLTVLGIGSRTCSVEQCVQSMLLRQSQVCTISVESQHIGTGFLIQPDCVMTNWHVLDALQKGQGQIQCTFDHDGSCELDTLQRFEMHSQLVVCSSKTEPSADACCNLDYAVLRLARELPDREPMKVGRYVFRDDKSPVIIMHHPGSQNSPDPLPLQFSVGAIRDINDDSCRVSYTNATAPGASGSPVFSSKFELAAIHYHQQKRVNSHGIPIWAIEDDLYRQGHGNLLVRG